MSVKFPSEVLDAADAAAGSNVDPLGQLFRPMLAADIEQIHAQAVVDRSLEPAGYDHMSEGETAAELETDTAQPVFEDLGPNVQTLDLITRHDIPVNRVLQMALEAELKEVVICGVDRDGEPFFASSVADGGAVLWHLKVAEIHLMQIATAREGGSHDAPA